MRTTVKLDDDVAAEVEKLRRSEGLGISEAVNRLVRRGMAAPRQRVVYEHHPVELGLKIDVGNVAEVLDLLDET